MNTILKFLSKMFVCVVFFIAHSELIWWVAVIGRVPCVACHVSVVKHFKPIRLWICLAYFHLSSLEWSVLERFTKLFKSFHLPHIKVNLDRKISEFWKKISETEGSQVQVYVYDEVLQMICIFWSVKHILS